MGIILKILGRLKRISGKNTEILKAGYIKLGIRTVSSYYVSFQKTYLRTYHVNMIEYKEQYDQGGTVYYNSWKNDAVKVFLSTKCTKNWWKLSYLKFRQ